MPRALLLAASLLAALPARADDPICNTVDPIPGDIVSVAWVSRAGAHVGPSGKITVVPTRALRGWMAGQSADLARLLQGLGLRKKFTPPQRPWKVAVFEVDLSDACRPIDDAPTTEVAGVEVCRHGGRGVTGEDEGCGYTVDLATNTAGLDVLRIAWKDAAARGFCVLPAERFIRQH